MGIFSEYNRHIKHNICFFVRKWNLFFEKDESFKGGRGRKGIRSWTFITDKKTKGVIGVSSIFFFFAKGRFLLTSLSDNHTSIPMNEKNNSLRIVNFKAKRWQWGEFNHYYCHYYNKNKGDFQSRSEKELVWRFLENLWENNHNRVFLSRLFDTLQLWKYSKLSGMLFSLLKFSKYF